jgi:hypothetical protein
MTREQVTQLMSSCRTDKEWNDACKAVKAAFDGYPDYWFEDILEKGIAAKVLGETDLFHVE